MPTSHGLTTSALGKQASPPEQPCLVSLEALEHFACSSEILQQVHMWGFIPHANLSLAGWALSLWELRKASIPQQTCGARLDTESDLAKASK